jgi:4-diphosphocytidyl-2C-methyl-D-erythritol kinase
LANGAEAALLCGSGSTVFVICSDAATAQSLGQAIKSKFGQQSFVQTLPLPGYFPNTVA